jgi:hypothetical protein
LIGNRKKKRLFIFYLLHQSMPTSAIDHYTTPHIQQLVDKKTDKII